MSAGTIPEGDYENGKRIFKYRCQQCHAIDSTKCTKAGPGLHGIMGRKSGTIPGYVYSTAIQNKGLKWSRETLFEYLKDPRRYIPGTKMFFVGLKKAQDRADVIKYIEVECAKPPKEVSPK